MAARPIQAIGGMIAGRGRMAASPASTPTVAIAAIGSRRCNRHRCPRLHLQRRLALRAALNAYCAESLEAHAVVTALNDWTTRGISSEVETLHGSEIPENQESGTLF
jgi:hypothetical protein